MKWCVFLVLTLVSQASSLGLPDLGQLFGDFSDKMLPRDQNTRSTKARVKRQSIGDESPLPYEIIASSLPLRDGVINDRYMPTLGNGHIATTVYHDSIFVNGLYNGVQSESHRAKIPARVMSRIKISNEDVENRATRKFILNAEEGYFMETIDCDFAMIEHRIYIHKYYIRLLVSTISWRKKSGGLGGGRLLLEYPDFDTEDDIDFDSNNGHYAHFHTSGRTKEAEEGSSNRDVHIFWMDPVNDLPIQGGEDTQSYTVIMSVDLHESDARSDFDEALRILDSSDGHAQLFELHTNAWRSVWSNGYLEVVGDKHLAKLTRFSQYYILTSLPSPDAYQPPKHSDFLYGVSRSSLAKGSNNKDYQGHIMWDSEVYILPAVVLFHPQLAKSMLRYRKETAEQARLIAEAMGAQGYKYAYRSGYTGAEISPGDCPECEQQKYHVSADIAWGIRQYYSATRDRSYLIDTDHAGCDISREIARFFADRAVYDPEIGRYNIEETTGPDLNYKDQKNNAYTLAAASLAIHYARYLACECQRSEREEVPDQWIEIALYLNLPFDNVMRVHNQYEGFEEVSNPRLDQADTIMLTYPLNWNMSTDIMRHDLEFYEQITNDVIPAMTWSFFTIGWKWVEDYPKMESYFLKSYQDYLVEPFKIWTEYNEATDADQDVGNVNFLPGMGAFLQSIIYGFAGIRIRPEMLEFHRPKPPAENILKLNSMKYLGTNMTIEIQENAVYITVHNVGDFPLVLRKNDTTFFEESLTAGAYITIENPDQGFFIYTNDGSGCEHPRDHMYMPWGYSPYFQSGNRFNLSLILLVSTLMTVYLV